MYLLFPGLLEVRPILIQGRRELLRQLFRNGWEWEWTEAYTPTFGRAQDICVAEATHEGYTAEHVQLDCPRVEVLHGHIPHLADRGEGEYIRGQIAQGPAPALPATLLTSNPAKWKASAISRSPLLPSSRRMATRGVGPPRGRVSLC